MKVFQSLEIMRMLLLSFLYNFVKKIRNIRSWKIFCSKSMLLRIPTWRRGSSLFTQLLQDVGRLVRILLADDQELGGDLRVQSLLGDLVEELVLELVDVTDGLQDDVQLWDGGLPGNGGNEIFKPGELYGCCWLLLDSGSGLNASERIRRRGRPRWS